MLNSLVQYQLIKTIIGSNLFEERSDWENCLFTEHSMAMNVFDGEEIVYLFSPLMKMDKFTIS